MSLQNGSYSILLGADEDAESTSIIVTTTEKVGFPTTTLIIIILGILGICTILFIVFIGICCCWEIFTPEKTPVVKAKVPVEKAPRKKGDNNKSRYLVHKKGSYEKTIYFTNFSGQTKDSSSLQNSRKSPKLNNPKFNQQKSQSVSKLMRVSPNASLPAGSKTRMWKNRSSKTKIPKQTSGSVAKSESLHTLCLLYQFLISLR